MPVIFKVARVLSQVALIGLLVRPLWAQEAAAPGELKPGEVLNQTNWQKAEGLLPPEILKHYQNGDDANPIVDWPDGKFTWPADFRAASEKNAGQLDVDATGTVIEKGSGKQPPYILGHPFPIIDRADPKAGAKAVWNFVYRTWYFGTNDGRRDQMIRQVGVRCSGPVRSRPLRCELVGARWKVSRRGGHRERLTRS